jgi:hypothetical protein
MNKSFPIGSALVLVALLAGGAWYLSHAKAPAAPTGGPRAVAAASTDLVPAPGFATASTSAEVPVAGPLAPARTAPAGARAFRSEPYRFSLFYPDNLTEKSYDEGGGATTFVFQNPQEAKGFQLFVVPYAAYQVSLARFREDEPSGVMQSPQNVTINGTPATSFYGSDQTLGPTAEVWFIRGGYLFEVSAPKSEAAWLSGILQTWQFL